ncbi:MAG: tetratricopeptide repeat protein [Candidatus Riflebacteria bacterium]|nr:tetratricopeptide repeat protein [Candidatus Riflebacteria bacterium]
MNYTPNKLRQFGFLLLVTAICLLPLSLYSQSNEAKELNRLGTVALRSGRYADAVRDLNKAISLAPDWAEPYYNAAQLLERMGSHPKALQMYKKAFELDKNNYTYKEAYRVKLLEALRDAERTRDKSAAENIKADLLSVDPGNVTYNLALVNRLRAQGQNRQALAAGEGFLQNHSSFRRDYNSRDAGEFFLQMSQLYLSEGNLAEAERSINEAGKYPVKQSPQYDSALSLIKGAQSDKVAMLLNNANVAERGGDLEKAKAIYEEAVEKAPNSDLAKKGLARIKTAIEVKNLTADLDVAQRKKNWLDIQDIARAIQDLDSSDIKSARLYEEASAKERQAMAIRGEANQFSRELRVLQGMIKLDIDKAKNFVANDNFDAARGVINSSKALTELVPELSPMLSFYDELEAKMTKVETNSEIWEKAKDARAVGDYAEVVNLLKRLPSNYPEPHLRSIYAEAAWKTGDAEKAKELALLDLAENPDNNRSKFVLGNLYREENNASLSQRYFKEIYETDKDYPGLSDLYMEASFKNNFVTIALVVVIILIITVVVVFIKKFDDLKKSSDFSKAESYLKSDYFTQAIEILLGMDKNPTMTANDRAKVSKMLTKAYLSLGKYIEAIGTAKHLLTININDREAQEALGRAYLGLQRVNPESLPYLLQMNKTTPNNLPLLSLLGRYYSKQARMSKEGIEILEAWIEMEPNSPEPLKPLALHYLKTGEKNEKAMAIYGRMIGLGFEEPAFLVGVARVYASLNAFDKALELCEKVIAASPDNEFVHPVLRDVYNRQNKLDDLMTIYRNFLQVNPYNVAFQKAVSDLQNLIQQQQERGS